MLSKYLFDIFETLLQYFLDDLDFDRILLHYFLNMYAIFSFGSAYCTKPVLCNFG